MSTETTEAPAKVEEPAKGDAAEKAPEDKPLGEAGQRALDARTAEKRAAEQRAKAAEKRAEELEAELRKAREKEMSDLERAQESAKRAEAERDAARVEALRFRVAAKYQISGEDAETFLTAADEDGITRQAERLAALAKAGAEREAEAAAKAAEPKTPKPDPSQGARGSTPKTTLREAYDRRQAELAARAARIGTK